MAAEERERAEASPADSLEAFAADLRELRMAHAALQPGGYGYFQAGWRVEGTDQDRYRPSRSAIYAALSGKTLPLAPTLLALLEEWGEEPDALLDWLKRRDGLQRQLAISARGRGGRPIPSPQRTNSHARELRDYMQELRKKSGRTIADIAQHAGASPVTLAAALRGPRLPSWSTIDMFLEGLEINGNDVYFKYYREPSWDDPAFLLTQSNVLLRLRGLWLAARAAAKDEAGQTSTRAGG